MKKIMDSLYASLAEVIAMMSNEDLEQYKKMIDTEYSKRKIAGKL